MRFALLAFAVFCFSPCVLAQDKALGAPPVPIPQTERRPGNETHRIRPARDATTRPSPPPFIIGVWYPPAASMPVWKARGVNTVIGYEHESQKVSMDEWTDAAAGQGLFMIRQPRMKVEDDLNEPYLLAWMQIDEPDLKGVGPPVLAERYGQWKKDAPKMPVFLSVSGGGVLFRKTPRVTYQQYLESADWIANDFYPVTGWNQPTWIPRLGQAVDLCRTISGGKPQFAFIETSSQQLAWMPRETRGVTPAELRAEIWEAVIHGVKGIVYFPQQFNPFQYDATPSNVSVEMARQNRILAELAPILSLPANPKEIGVSVASPLEAAWRKAAAGTIHLIILNPTAQALAAQVISIKGMGSVKQILLKEGDRSLTVSNQSFTDDFDPHQARIYTIGKASESSH
jgi:hypothetical protein